MSIIYFIWVFSPDKVDIGRSQVQIVRNFFCSINIESYYGWHCSFPVPHSTFSGPRATDLQLYCAIFFAIVVHVIRMKVYMRIVTIAIMVNITYKHYKLYCIAENQLAALFCYIRKIKKQSANLTNSDKFYMRKVYRFIKLLHKSYFYMHLLFF